MKLLGVSADKIEPQSKLVEEILDRSGQPELYNYFEVGDQPVVPSNVKKNIHKQPTSLEFAKNIKSHNPSLSPREIAQKVYMTDTDMETINWMRNDLKDYLNHFDEYFEAKLSRGKKKQLQNGEIEYIDSWAVPYFNTNTQTKAEAKKGVESALKKFEGIQQRLTHFEYSEMMALYARPEFDDVRRYKLKLFPSQPNPYEKERSDAKSVGDRYPTEWIIPVTRDLALDELSFTSGRHVHFVGLIPHSSTLKADGRTFVGTADFLEHDLSHGYFSLQQPLPGNEDDWIRIHEGFKKLQSTFSDAQQRAMNSLIYFHFTHESEYKHMIPALDGTLPDLSKLNLQLEEIKNKLGTEGHYYWIPSSVGPEHAELLPKAFDLVTEYLLRELKTIENRDHCKNLINHFSKIAMTGVRS